MIKFDEMIEESVDSLYELKQEEIDAMMLEEGKFLHFVNSLFTFLPGSLAYLIPFFKTLGLLGMSAGSTISGIVGGGLSGFGVSAAHAVGMHGLTTMSLGGVASAFAVPGAAALKTAVAAGGSLSFLAPIAGLSGGGLILIGVGALITAGILTKDVAKMVIKRMRNKEYERIAMKALDDPRFMSGIKALNLNMDRPSDKDKKKILAFAKKYQLKGE